MLYHILIIFILLIQGFEQILKFALSIYQVVNQVYGNNSESGTTTYESLKRFQIGNDDGSEISKSSIALVHHSRYILPEYDGNLNQW